jgi:transcriptional regulator GlxA family with amidase domain
MHHLLEWIEANAAHPITLAAIARQGSISIRTLNRQFRVQLGTTPLQWLLLRRIDQAQRLLETTDHSIDRIAGETGIGSATTLRYHFARAVGVSPSAYRTSFTAPKFKCELVTAP